MRYHCLHIENHTAQEWQKDLFDLHICELGVDTIDGNDYYIQSVTWENNHEDIEALCTYTEGITLLGAEACPDENWNALWEAEHPIQELPMGIQIIPHCAFGAGHHETTSMMIEQLMNTDLFGKTVLDHGTGTGVLAIFAKRLGASLVIAIDIDDKSVENAMENAALNRVEMEVRLASTPPNDIPFDFILANIHRNILLENMASYAAALQSGGELWLSGFYASDCPALIEAGEAQGLHLITTHSKNEWCMLQLKKSN